MCGRFSLIAPESALADMFGVDVVPTLPPRRNIAPTQPVAAARVSPERGEREIAMLRWGLIPPWAKDPAIGSRMINARAETVSGKPAFRAAFRQRRCLVPASGFYEWRRLRGRKQPYSIHFRDGRPFAIAGLWERWGGPEGPAIESCALITTGANEAVFPLHDRMPAILSPQDFDLWLDPAVQTKGELLSLLRPFPAGEMTATPVSELSVLARSST